MEGYPTKEELLVRLQDHEDNFTERKPERANNRELRKTIVGFANSVPEGRTAVLFIGVSDKGEILGVSNPDSLQKKVRNICTQDCYPQIICRHDVIQRGGKSVVAVVVSSSKNRPHFSGPAYIRQGSETIIASELLFDEMIVSRQGKPHEILKWKGKLVTVITSRQPRSKSGKFFSLSHFSDEFKIEECTANRLKLYHVAAGRHVSYPLERISISFD
ncbi:MAG: ATP-binding protein [bacterium]